MLKLKFLLSLVVLFCCYSSSQSFVALFKKNENNEEKKRSIGVNDEAKIDQKIPSEFDPDKFYESLGKSTQSNVESTRYQINNQGMSHVNSHITKRDDEILKLKLFKNEGNAIRKNLQNILSFEENETERQLEEEILKSSNDLGLKFYDKIDHVKLTTNFVQSTSTSAPSTKAEVPFLVQSTSTKKVLTRLTPISKLDLAKNDSEIFISSKSEAEKEADYTDDKGTSSLEDEKEITDSLLTDENDGSEKEKKKKVGKKARKSTAKSTRAKKTSKIKQDNENEGDSESAFSDKQLQQLYKFIKRKDTSIKKKNEKKKSSLRSEYLLSTLLMSPQHEVHSKLRDSLAAKAANKALLKWHSKMPLASLHDLEMAYNKFYEYFFDHLENVIPSSSLSLKDEVFDYDSLFDSDGHFNFDNLHPHGKHLLHHSKKSLHDYFDDHSLAHDFSFHDYHKHMPRSLLYDHRASHHLNHAHHHEEPHEHSHLNLVDLLTNIKEESSSDQDALSDEGNADEEDAFKSDKNDKPKSSDTTKSSLMNKLIDSFKRNMHGYYHDDEYHHNSYYNDHNYDTLHYPRHHNYHYHDKSYLQTITNYYFDLKKKLDSYYLNNLSPPSSLVNEYHKQKRIYTDMLAEPLAENNYHHSFDDIDHHDLMHEHLPLTQDRHHLHQDQYHHELEHSHYHPDEYLYNKHLIDHNFPSNQPVYDKYDSFLYHPLHDFSTNDYKSSIFCNNYPDHSSEGFKSFISVESCMQPSYLSSAGIPVFGDGCTFRYICDVGYLPIGGVNAAIKCNNGFWSERALCIKQEASQPNLSNAAYTNPTAPTITNANSNPSSFSNQAQSSSFTNNTNGGSIASAIPHQPSFIKRMVRSAENAEKSSFVAAPRYGPRKQIKETMVQRMNIQDKKSKKIIDDKNTLIETNSDSMDNPNVNFIVKLNDSYQEPLKMHSNFFNESNKFDGSINDATSSPTFSYDAMNSTQEMEIINTSKVLNEFKNAFEKEKTPEEIEKDVLNLDYELSMAEKLSKPTTTTTTTTTPTQAESAIMWPKIINDTYNNKQNKSEAKQLEEETPSLDWPSIVDNDSEKTIYESFHELLDNEINDSEVNSISSTRDYKMKKRKSQKH